MYGKMLGIIETKYAKDSEPAILLNSFYEATEAIKKCESGFHLWKFIETPAWKSLIKHCDIIDK